MGLLSTILDKVKNFKPGATEESAKEINNCSEDALDDKDSKTFSNTIKENDSYEERSKKMADVLSSCGEQMTAVDDKDSVQTFNSDPCMKDKIRLLTEDIKNSMGMGIDESTPFQEGFIPPPCYEYAQKIIDAVRNDALFSNKGSKVDTNYNSAALLLDEVVTEMRDFHELSKFMITIQDDSEGSRELMKNTANNKKYNQIYMNKDVTDYRDVIFNVKRENKNGK